MNPVQKAKSITTHETFESGLPAPPPSERSFAWVFTVFFLAVGLWPMRHRGSLRWWAVATAAAVFLIGLFRPSLLRIPNLIWFRFGNFLGRIVSPIAMSLLFYIVFTPIALMARLTGKDLLHLKRDPRSSSYWINREPPGPLPESMKEQF